ncbi:hypothetical protein ACQR2L_07530 [Clostridium butyricum]|uniref:hypothetical protein n=1 Tax=Clostridium butyricum TaxID=1492 RepID=UPI003D09608A
MAESKCIKCGSNKFEMVKNDNLKYVQLVQCAECGAVIGVVEDIDFRKEFDLVINNEVGLERCINTKENNLIQKLNEMEKDSKETLETIQEMASALYKHGIR